MGADRGAEKIEASDAEGCNWEHRTNGTIESMNMGILNERQ
jgi:hypothetical protein